MSDEGNLSVRETGRRGGNKVKRLYGPEFFQRIGKMGGEAVRDRHGKDYYGRIGKMGGSTEKANRKR